MRFIQSARRMWLTAVNTIVDRVRCLWPRRIPALRTYPETWRALEQCGPPEPYRKTFQYQGDYLSDFHAFLGNAPTGRLGSATCIDIGLDGYLQRADALKLYELAYFSDGDILELGTHKGLSASIIVRALADGGSPFRLETTDIDPQAGTIAREVVSVRRGAGRVNFNLQDAAECMDRFAAAGRKFGFICVDHWHGYEATHQAAIRVAPLLSKGGFMMFHDFNDTENVNPADVHKVYQAVSDTLGKDPAFQFSVLSGCCGIYQKCA